MLFSVLFCKQMVRAYGKLARRAPGGDCCSQEDQGKLRLGWRCPSRAARLLQNQTRLEPAAIESHPSGSHHNEFRVVACQLIEAAEAEEQILKRVSRLVLPGRGGTWRAGHQKGGKQAEQGASKASARLGVVCGQCLLHAGRPR